jgi:hypothetical protein
MVYTFDWFNCSCRDLVLRFSYISNDYKGKRISFPFICFFLFLAFHTSCVTPKNYLKLSQKFYENLIIDTNLYVQITRKFNNKFNNYQDTFTVCFKDKYLSKYILTVRNRDIIKDNNDLFDSNLMKLDPRAYKIYQYYISTIADIFNPQSMYIEYYNSNQLVKLRRSDEKNHFESEIWTEKKDDHLVLTKIINSKKEFINDTSIFSIFLSKPENISLDNFNIDTIRMSCDSILPLNTISEYSNYPLKQVVIYSYIGCKPCTLLKNDLIECLKNNQIDTTSILFLNVKDHPDFIISYQNQTQFPFKIISKYNVCQSGGFPKVGGYSNEKKLIWSENGYYPGLSTQIKKFLGN